MGFIRPVAIAVALALSFLTAADAAGPLRPFKAGFWAGGAYTDDRTGAFTHCSAGVAYNSGINLFILVTGDYHWWLGFINPKWSLNPRDQVPVSLQFDAAPPLARLGTIPSPQLLLVPLPNALRIMLQPRQSPELGVSAEGRSFLFKLDDVQAVIDRLANCVRAARGQEPPVREATAAAAGRAGGSPIAGQPSPGGAPAASGSAAPASAALAAPVYSPDAPNPPSRSSGSDRANQNVASSPTGESAVTPDAVAQGSSSPANQLAPGSPTASQAAAPALAFTALPSAVADANAREEYRLAAQFVAKAGMRGAQLIPADKPPPLADFTAVWQSPNAAGAVKIIPSGPNVSALGIASNLIAVDPQLCHGDFSAARFRTDIGDRAVFSAVLSCFEANVQRLTEYFVAPLRESGYAVFVVIRRQAGAPSSVDRQGIEDLSRAAIEAIQGRS